MNQDMIHDNDPLDRRLELLADKALQGLDDLETDELSTFTSLNDLAGFDLEETAAVLAALECDRSAPLPKALVLRLERDAAAVFSPGKLDSKGRRRAIVQQLGWWVAAASIAFGLFHLPRTIPVETNGVRSIEAQLEGSPSSPFENRNHPLGLGAKGKVTWNSDRQQGYLALQGLAPVDRSDGIYQLWIFDADRDERYPVDGGIFAIDKKGSTAIIPIHPGIVVKTPTLFAVTLEPPGGVVVSDRKRILLTAKWEPTATDQAKKRQ